MERLTKMYEDSTHAAADDLPCGEWTLKKADESNFRGINYGKDIEEDNK